VAEATKTGIVDDLMDDVDGGEESRNSCVCDLTD